MSSRVQLIIGKQRRGKSTLAYHKARLEGKPVVVFDPRAQFNFEAAGGSTAYGQAGFEDLLERGKFPIVYRPGHDVRESFADFVEVLLEIEALAVVVDEARYLMTAQAIDEDLSVLLRAYGQQDHSIYLTAHRMAHIHGDIAEPADSIVFFGTHHKKSLDRISDFTSEQVADRVRELSGRDFLEWSDDSEDFLIQRDANSWREQISPHKPAEKTARAAA